MNLSSWHGLNYIQMKKQRVGKIVKIELYTPTIAPAVPKK